MPCWDEGAGDVRDALCHLQGVAVLGATFEPRRHIPPRWHSKLSPKMIPFPPKLDHICQHQSQ